MENIYQFLGLKIREERKRLKLTQERLAEIADLSVAFVGQIERGVNKASHVTLEKIAKALNLSVSELFSELPIEIPDREVCITDQIEALLKNKSPKEKEFVRELIKFVVMFLSRQK